MCNIWKKSNKTEISSNELEQIISNKLFSKVQIINLTGGEPTLRKDLPQIVHLLISNLQKLKKITLSSNGLNTERVVNFCTKICEECKKRNVDFSADLSIDGVGKAHDRIRNVPNAFERVTNTLFQLRQIHHTHNFRVGVSCTISPGNVYHVSDFQKWSREHDIKANFFITSFNDSYYSNEEDKERLQFKDDNKITLVSFLGELANQKSPFNFSAYYFDDMKKMLANGQRRTTPCLFSSEACILDAYGDLYYCTEGKKIGNCLTEDPYDIYFDSQNLSQREKIIRRKCPKCTMACFLETGIVKELTKYIKFLLAKG